MELKGQEQINGPKKAEPDCSKPKTTRRPGKRLAKERAVTKTDKKEK